MRSFISDNIFTIISIFISIGSPFIIYFFVTKKYEKLKHDFSKRAMYAEKRIEVLSNYYSLLSVFYDVNLKSLTQPYQEGVIDEKMKEEYEQYKNKKGASLDLYRFVSMHFQKLKFQETDNSKVEVIQYFLKNRPWFTKEEDRVIVKLHEELHNKLVNYKFSREDLGGKEDLKKWKDIWDELSDDKSCMNATRNSLTSSIREYYN